MISTYLFLVFCQGSLLSLISCRPEHHHRPHSHQSLDPKWPELSPESLPGTCLYGKVTYRAGEMFRPDPCTRCTCPGHGGRGGGGGGGRARCTIQDCRAITNCVRWKDGGDEGKEDGTEECCPTCLEIGCLHSDGKVYSPGAHVPVESPCETCECPEGGGRTICRHRVVCPRPQCVDAVLSEDQCCHVCPNGNNCWYKGEILRAGSVKEEGCRRCVCPDGPPPHWLPFNKISAVCSVIQDCKP